MAITMILVMLVVFMFFAVAFDSGVWFFDHRTASNQAEASALAAAQALPQGDSSLADTDTGPANTAANTWLTRNSADPCAPACATYGDWNDDGKIDTVHIDVERDSKGFFSQLSGIDFASISGGATARVGHASIANVMPWAIVPPDPDCGFDEVCFGDYNDNGVVDEGECQADFQDCPWGLNLDNLYAFKVGSGGGNTGIIDACGGGASSYQDCISGELVSGFFEEGTTVVVGLQGGNLGNNTNTGLTDRYSAENPNYQDCDVESTPSVDSHGYDPDGKAAFESTLDTIPECADRLVVIPILYSMPPQGGGSETLTVLGVATFGIAKWERDRPAKSAWGTTDSACQSYAQDPADDFECGMVWGYLVENAIPPDFLIEAISGTPNPLAPLLIALVE